MTIESIQHATTIYVKPEYPSIFFLNSSFNMQIGIKLTRQIQKQLQRLKHSTKQIQNEKRNFLFHKVIPSFKGWSVVRFSCIKTDF